MTEYDEDMTFEKFQMSKEMFNDPGDRGESPAMGCIYTFSGREGDYIIDWTGSFWETEYDNEYFGDTSLEEVEKWLYGQITHDSK